MLLTVPLHHPHVCPRYFLRATLLAPWFSITVTVHGSLNSVTTPVVVVAFASCLNPDCQSAGYRLEMSFAPLGTNTRTRIATGARKPTCTSSTVLRESPALKCPVSTMNHPATCTPNFNKDLSNPRAPSSYLINGFQVLYTLQLHRQVTYDLP